MVEDKNFEDEDLKDIQDKDLLYVPQTGEQGGTDDNYARWHVLVP